MGFLTSSFIRLLWYFMPNPICPSLISFYDFLTQKKITQNDFDNAKLSNSKSDVHFLLLSSPGSSLSVRPQTPYHKIIQHCECNTQHPWKRFFVPACTADFWPPRGLIYDCGSISSVIAKQVELILRWYGHGVVTETIKDCLRTIPVSVYFFGGLICDNGCISSVFAKRVEPVFGWYLNATVTVTIKHWLRAIPGSRKSSEEKLRDKCMSSYILNLQK